MFVLNIKKEELPMKKVMKGMLITMILLTVILGSFSVVSASDEDDTGKRIIVVVKK
jgi:hypothetical protein